MTIERLSNLELDRPTAMSSSETIDSDKAETYEHSPLLAKKTPRPALTPPSQRNSHSSSRWTISSLATHQENTTEIEVLKECSKQTKNQSNEQIPSRDLHLRLQPSDSPLIPLRRHARSRSASLPFLMLSNLQIQNPSRPAPLSSLKVVVLGESGVGKSSVVHEFLSCVDSEWPDNDSLITEGTEQTYCKSVLVDDDHVNLEIVDTPAYSSEDFEEREEDYLGNGDAFLLVYSVTNRRSFKKANELRFKLQRSKESETVPIILVGNKTDLERSREVSFAEGKHFAALFDCKLIETSATIGHNIDELFHGVVRQVRLRKEKQLEDGETMSGGSEDSGKSSPSMRKRQYSKKRRVSTVLNRARGMLERIWKLRGDEPIPGYRARSKSCHVMEIL